MEKVIIKTEFVTLSQFLKLANLVDSGGMVKLFIFSHNIYVNSTLTRERGKKLFKDDVVKVVINPDLTKEYQICS